MGLGIGGALKRGVKKAGKVVKRAGKNIDKASRAVNVGDPRFYTDMLKPPEINIDMGEEAPAKRTAPGVDPEAARIANMRKYQRKYKNSGRQGTMLTSGGTLG